MGEILVNNTEKIITNILEQARRERSVMLEIAEHRADDIRSEFLNKAKQEAQYVIHESENKAKNIIRVAQSQVELLIRKQDVQFQEAIFENLLKAIREKIDVWMRSPQYIDQLKKLIVDGVSVLAGDHFILKVRQEDLSLFDVHHLQNVIHQIKEKTNRNVTVELVVCDLEIMGGVIIYQGDQHVLIDNSFDKRLLRSTDEIRMRIARNLLK